MKKVTLYIATAQEEKTVSLEEELSLGRTDQARLVLPDAGLSRVNTTFFRDGEDILVVDENSLNGTFLNGEKLTGKPRLLFDGDEVKIGSETRIRIEIEEEFGEREAKHRVADTENRSAPSDAFRQDEATRNWDIRTGKRIGQASNSGAQDSRSDIQDQSPNKLPPLVIGAAASFFSIIFLAVIGFLIASRYETAGPNGYGKPTPPPIRASAVIPVRVIDPLGGEDEDDLDDLIASWEVQEEEINAANVEDVAVASGAPAEETELSVTAAFLADRQAKAFERRNGEIGIRPANLDVPRELFGDGVIKQKAKLREMNAGGYRQPLDFAELAQKRIDRELIEMPMATRSFYLDVGGSAKDTPFVSFQFPDNYQEITPGTPKYRPLAELAANFAGQKYDLNNPVHRKQMRMRLLRMFNQRAKPILQELADSYFKQFNRPLRVTSLTRSMDYQIGLNASNANSFKVRDEKSLPPHTSGCAFDLARKHMTADEQNFVMKKLAEMENQNKLDALIEYGANACFHVFIYSDGIPPRM